MHHVISRFRRFNRFYTGVLGLLRRTLPDTGLTLARARVLFEVHRHPGVNANDLAGSLALDKGYLSRIIAGLVRDGYVSRQEGPSGRRAVPLRITEQGRVELKNAEAAADAQAAQLLGHLSPERARELVQALDTVENLLNPAQAHQPSLTIRDVGSGDLGWVISRHAYFYGREYGFNEEFERYVLLGMSEYCRQAGDCRSGLWIAEMDGEPVGSMGVVDAGDNRAQLRWLLVEPRARGLGAGRTLMQHALDYSRDQGYDAAFLWTIKPLHAARQMYRKLGFTLAETKDGSMGGVPMQEERWEIVLR